MKRKQKVIYIGPFSFPRGGAAARRILGNALSLREAGYEVVIASGQTQEGVREEDYPVIGEYEGFEVISLGERTAERYPRLLKHLMYFGMGRRSIAWLESLDEKPEALILYSGYSPYMMRLIPWCRRNGVKFIFDAVEWYDPKSFLSGLFSPYQWNIELALRHYSRKTSGVIAISSYLERHYAAYGAETVRVPPTLDTRSVTANLAAENDLLTLSYTGTPGHKDLFDSYLEAVLRLSEEGEALRFRFAGVTREQLLRYPALRRRKIGPRNLPRVLEPLGITDQATAFALTREADFSLLLRPPARYAQAGFPTKVVESLTAGTPVIANITSDLGDCLQDGENALVCTDWSVESLIGTIRRALHLSDEEKRSMRLQARRTAEVLFDYRCYEEALNRLLERVESGE